MPAVDFLPRKLYNAFSRGGFLSEPVKGLIALQGNPEYVAFWDDFMGDALDGRYAATVGTGTEVIGVTAALGGTMTLTTGSVGSDTAGQGLGLHWNGDRGFYFISRLKCATRITGVKFEIGMTDSVSDDGAVATKATPTFTATDCALFVLDTTEDAEVTFVSNGGTTDANADADDFTLVNDTYLVVEVVCKGATDTTGDNVAGYLNGQLVGSGNINGASPLTIWAYIEDLAQSTATTLTVDYWGCVGPRVAQWGVST